MKKNNHHKKYVFNLYVTGGSTNSLIAVSNIKEICEKYLANEYELEIIDLYREPHVAADKNIVALPMLIKKFPLPEKRFIGTMADPRKLLQALGIQEQ